MHHPVDMHKAYLIGGNVNLFGVYGDLPSVKCKNLVFVMYMRIYSPDLLNRFNDYNGANAHDCF